MNAWMALRSAMQEGQSRTTVRRATLRRVAAFARPHGRTIAAFLVLATTSAVLGVAAPVLSGRAVDAIVEGHDTGTVVTLAVLIAAVAVAEAGVGLVERLESSRLGERLILDLRRQVFGHVQRMPIAFFTRTHTGALVSRLNNDVIGAQRAFTSALGGVVTNVIALVLTLGVMVNAAYRTVRRSIGRSILLGLELLVAGDIIRTVAVDPTFTSVGVLAVIVAIRTFLSFTLELEITGRWPWQGAPDDDNADEAPRPSPAPCSG